MTSWAAAGVAIPRTAHEQAHFGIPITGLATLQPGDLLFIAGSHGTASQPGHVGMFIGTVNGIPFLVQARQTGTNVEVDPVSRWDGLIVAIRRPITR
jgi:cell wall-associated NlpC family hydrolase